MTGRTRDIIVDIGDETYEIDLISSFPIQEYANFIDLNDTPGSYMGQAHLVPRVNNVEDGLEFHQLGIGDLDPKDHHLLNGLDDDDHSLYLRHDGVRELTGNLKPSASDTYDLGSPTAEFNTVYANNLNSIGFSDLVIHAQHIHPGHRDLILRAGGPNGRIKLDHAAESLDMEVSGNLDVSPGTLTPRVYIGDVEPAVPNNTTAYWHDTLNSKIWLILRYQENIHKVELV